MSSWMRELDQAETQARAAAIVREPERRQDGSLPRLPAALARQCSARLVTGLSSCKREDIEPCLVLGLPRSRPPPRDMTRWQSRRRQARDSQPRARLQGLAPPASQETARAKLVSAGRRRPGLAPLTVNVRTRETGGGREVDAFPKLICARRVSVEQDTGWDSLSQPGLGKAPGDADQRPAPCAADQRPGRNQCPALRAPGQPGPRPRPGLRVDRASPGSRSPGHQPDLFCPGLTRALGWHARESPAGAARVDSGDSGNCHGYPRQVMT